MNSTQLFIIALLGVLPSFGLGVWTLISTILNGKVAKANNLMAQTTNKIAQQSLDMNVANSLKLHEVKLQNDGIHLLVGGGLSKALSNANAQGRIINKI